MILVSYLKLFSFGLREVWSDHLDSLTTVLGFCKNTPHAINTCQDSLLFHGEKKQWPASRCPLCLPPLHLPKDTRTRMWPPSPLSWGKVPGETDTACGRDRSYKADGKARRASPSQSDVVVIIFAPLPALSRVHSKVQRQQLMLWICKWDHSWGGKTHIIKESSWGKRKATEHRLTPVKRQLNYTKGL